MKILTELIKKYIGDENITPKQLAPLDQHHIGGISTCQLMSEALSPAPRSNILDIGSGWGGPARYTAQHHNCNVHGIDIDKHNCDTAIFLSHLTNLDKQTSFENSNATEFKPDQKFDGAYMLHTSMCVKEKDQLIKTVYNALKPNAKFVILDVFSPQTKDQLTYPTPWAETRETSYLETINDMISRLEKNGFSIIKNNDLHDFAVEKVTKGLELIQQNELWAEATKLHLGENYHQKMQNLNSALLAKKCMPHMITAIKQ